MNPTRYYYYLVTLGICRIDKLANPVAIFDHPEVNRGAFGEVGASTP